jgi:hypothetical protein
MGKISAWTTGTMDRILDIMLGQGEFWRRDDIRYRDNTSVNKY